MVDVNVYQENLFHTKMRVKEFELDDYLFGEGVKDLDDKSQRRIRSQVHHEFEEIFYGRNMPK